MLVERIAPLLPQDARVLDIGAGDGTIAALLMERRPDVEISGVDVLVRPGARIAVAEFDGVRLPYADGSFDAAVLVDVVHHADEPETLLAEAGRVTSRRLVVKDHCADGLLAHPTLRFMDRTGNRRHGVALPYGYWSRERWESVLARLGLTVDVWESRLGLYPWPARPVFERSLHFLAALTPPSR